MTVDLRFLLNSLPFTFSSSISLFFYFYSPSTLRRRAWFLAFLRKHAHVYVFTLHALVICIDIYLTKKSNLQTHLVQEIRYDFEKKGRNQRK